MPLSQYISSTYVNAIMFRVGGECCTMFSEMLETVTVSSLSSKQQSIHKNL
ncbi:unnamed protein product [Rhodiola kirilowii]